MSTLLIRTSIGVVGLAVAWISLKSNMMMDSSNIGQQQQRDGVSYVSGFFEHDRQPTGPEQGFRAHTLPGFGILSRDYDDEQPNESKAAQWERFQAHLRHLNSGTGTSSRYKVLFVGRHGEGVHNVKEHEVGRAEWERHWSRLEGDGTRTWLDARLTDRGKQQAKALADFWQEGAVTWKMPLPESYYTSPLARCLETERLIYSELQHLGSSYRPVVKDAIREIYGVHTCDKRSSTSWIQSNFPEALFDPSFTEQDELWTQDVRETLEERVPVMANLLEELFKEDSATFISLTMHSGAIRALYLATSHPDVWVAAGAIVPIVICKGCPRAVSS